MDRGRTWRWLGLAMLAVGCGAEASSPEPDPVAEPTRCTEGEIELDDACLPVGVAPDACAEGFVSDERGGCLPILPEEPCPAGEMALPGESACRPVAPCGDDPWAGIPLDDGPVTYVDASFVGTSTGTKDAPFTTVVEAIQQSASGSVVAMAPGSYPVSQQLSKPLRFWGRCPRDVEWVWAGTIGTILTVTPQASGSEFHRIAFTSDLGDASVTVAGENVLFDEIWLHDANFGLAAVDVVMPASMTVRRSLIESVKAIGLFAGGSTVVVEQSVIRDMRPADNGAGGGAIFVSQGPSTMAPSTLIVERSVVAGAYGAGITGNGSGLTVRASVIRDVMVESLSGQDGIGLVTTTGLGEPGTPGMILEGSVVERVATAGVLGIGAPVAIRDSVIRTVEAIAMPGQVNGEGLVIQSGSAGISGSLEASGVLVEGSEVGGVLILDSTAQLSAMLLRDVGPGPEQIFGDGLMTVTVETPAAMTLSRSRVEAMSRAGVTAFGASLQVGETVFVCNPIDIAAEVQGAFEPAVTDAGGNQCLCGEESWPCKASSANLAPPVAL